MDFSSAFLSASKKLSRIAGILVSTVGLLVLIGWIFGIETLKSAYGSITMKTNAAVCLLLSGASLYILHHESNLRLRKAVGSFFAITVVLIGSLTLSEHLIGWNLGIDELLFTEPPGAVATASPGRMGPPASSCFMAAGIALILLHRGSRRIALAQFLALCVFLWSLLVVLGYTYSAEQLYGIARYTGIAFHTALCILLLAVGLLAARVDLGLMAVVAAEHGGGAMARRLILPAIVLPLVLGWLRLVGQRAGYFDLGFGTALSMLLIICFFLVSIWRNAVIVDKMEHKRLAAEEALRTTQERFNVAIKHAPVIVFSQDAALRYTWVFTPIFGLKNEEVLGKTDEELLPAADANVLTQIKKGVMGSGDAAHQEVKIHHTNRDHFYDLTVEPLVDDSSRVTGVICAAIDITERKHIEAQLRRANKLKDEFLTTLSHELRNPLNAILGYATVLQRSQLDRATTARALDAISRSARMQAQIIEDLLDVSRIISGKLHLEVRPIQLSNVVRAALESVRHAAESREIQIKTTMNREAESIVGDPIRLQQVLWNLLSNAVKFTPEGGTIEIALQRIDTRAELRVTDTGEGISPDFLPYVFDRFQQADGSITRRHGGLGLGLAIARHLVEMHGGTIDAFSEGMGKGATFSVRLPLVPLAQAQEKTIEVEESSTLETADSSTILNSERLKDLRILAVDDDADSRNLLQIALTGNGAHVAVAESASEALEQVPEWKPHLLICDIGMPHEDGLSLIRRIRTLPADQGGTVPAIALTGYARVEDRIRALDAGFQMFFPKPVRVSELISVIEELIGNTAR